MRFGIFRPRRLARRIQLATVLALLVLGGGAGALLYSLHRRDLIRGLQESMTVQGGLLEQGLRHAMLDRNLGLLDGLVRRLGEERGVECVFIVNKSGSVRFSSDTTLAGFQFSESDPTCLICHKRKPAERNRTIVYRKADGRRVLRNVNPIRNGPKCVRCHPASEEINGVLIVDHSLVDIDARLRREAGVFALGTLAAMAALATVLGLLLHRLVLRPIAEMRSAVTAMERGDLDEESELDGRDEMSSLVHQFNRMAGSLGRTMSLLREREQYLARILNGADDGMVVVDRDLHVVTANNAYLALCRRTHVDVVGEVCCFAPQCRRDQQGDCPSWSVFQSGKSKRIIRRIVDERGEGRTFEICASPLAIDGKIDQALEVWRDITERTRLEAELAHSERLASLGFLASGISHEINNPLATITTCLDGLQRRFNEEPIRNSPGTEVAAPYIELIQKEVRRCRDLTKKLGLLSRKSAAVHEPVDLNAAIAETASLIRFEIENHRASLECDLADELPHVEGDEARIRQVLLNLMLNAVDAIDEGGSIRVRSRSAGGDRVEITIADNGCGIASSELDRVFEPFYSKRKSRHGTGLGLFISNQIVRLHGGTIEIRSQLGEGTEVSVILPVDGGRAHEGPDLRTPG